MADNKATAPHKLDLAGLGRETYLIKVPKYVADSWNEAALKGATGTPLARIRLAPTTADQDSGAAPIDPTARQEGNGMQDISHAQPSASGRTHVMELTGNVNAHMPHTFRLRQQGRGSDTLVALQEASNQTKLVATVRDRFDTAVLSEAGNGAAAGSAIDPRYAALTRARNEAASKKRTMQVIDNPQAVRQMAAIPTNPKAARTKPGEKQEWEHRARLDKDKLESRLFRLFEKQTHWKFAELQKATDQPTAWLKEVLLSVALINKRGPYIGTWELKREYRLGQQPG